MLYHKFRAHRLASKAVLGCAQTPYSYRQTKFHENRSSIKLKCGIHRHKHADLRGPISFDFRKKGWLNVSSKRFMCMSVRRRAHAFLVYVCMHVSMHTYRRQFCYWKTTTEMSQRIIKTQREGTYRNELSCGDTSYTR